MEVNREKLVVRASAVLVLFSAALISYSGLTVLSAQPKQEQESNSSSFNTNTSQVLGAASVSTTPTTQPPTTRTTRRVESTSTQTTVSAQPVITQTTQYINATPTPLEEIKPKDFYFTSVATDLSVYRFRVKYLDGSFSGFSKIEGFDNMKGDNFVAIRASTIYTFDQPFTEIEIENNPGDIAVTFINAPGNTITAAAFDVAYTFERDYKNALFSNFGINIITREEWGAPSYSEWIPDFAKVNRVVVHHTATSVDLGTPANTVRAIYNEHKIRCSDNSGYYPSNCSIENTWSDIGYNYLIDPYGNVYEGRSGGNGSIGAHAIPNSGAIGISLLGNYSTTAPSAAMLNSLTQLTGALSFLNEFNVQWQQSLYGHRDYLNTECPGNNVYNILPQLAVNAEAARLAYQNGSQNQRNLYGDYSFGQRFIASNPSITDEDGNSHIYLVTDNITSEMRDKLKGTSNWSGSNGSTIFGDNVLYYVNVNLAPRFVGELSLTIPNLQFSTDLP